MTKPKFKGDPTGGAGAKPKRALPPAVRSDADRPPPINGEGTSRVVISTPDEPGRGWTWVIGSPKWHYFADGGTRSLCERWLILGDVARDLQDDNHDSADNCKACQGIRLKRIEKGTL